jgi:hypothetical protein
MALATITVFSVLIGVNVIVASLGYLQFLFIGQLGGPASIFFDTVRDVSRDPESVTDAGTDDPGR